MTFKRMLRLAFTFSLLSAGFTIGAVEAAQVVTLKDGKTISWSEFVDVVNGRKVVEGSVDPNSAVATNKTAKEEAYNTARDNQKAAADLVASTLKAYNDKEAELKQNQNALVPLKEERQGYLDQIAVQQKIIDDAPGKKTALETRRDQLKSIYENLPKVETKERAPWASTILNALSAFQYEWEKNIKPGSKEVFYKTFDSRGIVTLNISFVNPADILEAGSIELDGWTTTKQGPLYDYILSPNTRPSYIQILLGSAYVKAGGADVYYLSTSYIDTARDYVFLMKNINSELTTLLNQDMFKETIIGDYKNPTYAATVKQDLDNVIDAIDQLDKDVDAAKKEIDRIKNDELKKVNDRIAIIQQKIDAYILTVGEDGLTQQARLLKAYNDAVAAKPGFDDALTTAKTAYDEAVAAYNRALDAAASLAMENYKEIGINDNVTVTEGLKSFNGTITGNNHVITLATGVNQLFTSHNGTMSEVAVNGKISTSGDAKYYTVASVAKDASNTPVYTYYNEAGVKNTTAFASVSELGYAARNNFGVDVQANKLTTLAAEAKVYKITVYELNGTSTVSYVQKTADGKLTKDGQPFVIPANRFAKSETYDLTGVNNVFYNDNTCKSAVITDKETFFVPADIQVESLTYDRQFRQGQSVVCLPFDIDKDKFQAIDYVAKYEMETPERFWFKKVAGVVSANTPLLMGTNDTFSFGTMSNVTLKETEEFIITDEGDRTDPSKAIGILKKANLEELAGATKADYIFGLKDNGMFQRAGATAVFPAMRMYLCSNTGRSPQQVRSESSVNNNPDEKGIGFIDDDTTLGVDNVEATGLTVTGKQGEIEFTSESDYNKVGIYNVAGSLVAVADVKVGTTTVEVPAGLYIVMGKKVLVK